MTQKTVLICDRCGVEGETPKLAWPLKTVSGSSYYQRDKEAIEKAIADKKVWGYVVADHQVAGLAVPFRRDLCPSCYSKFIDFVRKP